MLKNLSRPLIALFSLLMVFGLPVVGAQDSAATPVAEAGEIAALVEELGEVRARLEAEELDDSLKAPIGDRLDEASNFLDEAAADRRRSAELTGESPMLPQRIEALGRELEGLSTPETLDLEMPDEAEALRAMVEQKRAEVATLEAEVAAKERELTDLKARPVEIATRLPAANAELSQAQAAVAALGEPGDESIGEAADRVWERSRLLARQAEVERLGNERIGGSLREERLGLEKQLLERRLANGRAALAEMEAGLKQRRQGEIEQLRIEVGNAVDSLPEGMAAWDELAAELPGLVEILEGKANQIAKASADAEVTRAKLEKLRRENDRLRRQIELGGLEGAFTQVLLDQRQRMPDRRALDYDLKRLDDEIVQAQLDGLRYDDLAEQQRELEERWGDEEKVQDLLEARRRVVDRLATTQRSLIRELAQWGADGKAYRDLSVELSQFLSDQLFWRRSSDAIGLRFFTQMPAAVGTVLSPTPWRNLMVSLSNVPWRHPTGTVGFGLAVVVLLAARRRLRSSIEKSGRRIRKISTDRMVHTLRALLDSLLLALPLPLVLAFLSWAFASEPDAAPAVRGFGVWLGWTSLIVMWILTLREISREGGVGQLHFGWDAGVSRILSLSLARLAAVYLPAMLLACLTLFDDESHAFDSLGRLGFILGQLGFAWVLAEMLRPDRGVFADIIRKRPDRLLARWRVLWFGILVGIPLVLAAMAIAGYTLTALLLSEEFLSVMRWIGLGVVVYGVCLRWFMIKQRRLALAEAIEARRARREATEKPEEEAEEMVSVDDDQIELGLDDVAQQTRRLLRSLVGIGVVVAIAYSVAAALPVDQAAAEASIAGGLDWLGVLKALLIFIVTFTVVKNLPGLLDMAGLRESGMEPGTRYALATLCQYALGAIGIFFVTDALELDWSRFGWIAAALSVGLGFGLQEIVANFVCGIIILFERPIRVGDVVTIGDVTGTVSRVRMRATTITNWERQEFVVPNKDFITGSLINWTLSSPLNRITVPVGVAYGSDTVEARRILTEIAEAHPVVLDDPAPLISFEAFADSTLNLSLRCYLPNMENRLKTITEIHEEIDRRFKEAGLEIAFPQRDLHLRSVPDELIRGRPPEPASD